MNYSDLIIEGTAILKEANIAEAALDARLLLEYICHTDRNTLYAHPDLQVSEYEEEAYRSLLAKRTDHIPLQHITGYQEFMGLNFKVTPDVLVPRQDTEFLVEEAMKYVQDGMRVLDLCTGSGCILLSIMKYKNMITGIGVDISEKALSIARINAERLNVLPEPKFLQGDLYEPVQSYARKFDVIISNPPYIRPDVIKTLMPEVRDHEPLLALDGGEDGLDFYRKIISGARNHLTNYGYMLLEIGHDQGPDVIKLMVDSGFSDVKCLIDYAGNPRVVTGKLVLK